MLHIATISGGTSTEAAVSRKNAQSIEEALVHLGFNVTALAYDRRLPSLLEQQRPDAVFLCVQGKGHGDGTCQGLLDFYGIPYTGSGREAATLINNKIFCQRLFAQEGLPIPRNFLWSLRDHARSDARELFLHRLREAGFDFPCVVKAPSQGGSFGIVLLESIDEFERISGPFTYDSTLLVEEFIFGGFYTVGLLADREGGIEALPVIEGVDLDSGSKIITFGGRYTARPASLPERLCDKMRALALRVFSLVGARDYARVDFMLDTRTQTPRILEINAVPGLKPESLYPPAAALAGIEYDDMIARILQRCLKGACTYA
ncbi:MAG: D-alanine--D-alanine ligase family protein [Oscillospiraceae bacterium]|jgi:D-alanine-D-alanine ligase